MDMHKGKVPIPTPDDFKTAIDKYNAKHEYKIRLPTDAEIRYGFEIIDRHKGGGRHPHAVGSAEKEHADRLHHTRHGGVRRLPSGSGTLPHAPVADGQRCPLIRPYHVLETEDEKYAESVRKEHAEEELTRDDLLVLEMIRRNEQFALLGVGTMRLTKSTLRLYCRGLVDMEDASSLSFDERERMQAFLDSPPAKRYAENLAKVAEKEDKRFFKAAAEIMGAPYAGRRGLPSVVKATAEGRKLLSGAGPPHDYDEERDRRAGTALALYGGSAGNGGRQFAMYGLGLLVGGVLTGSVMGGMDSG